VSDVLKKWYIREKERCESQIRKCQDTFEEVKHQVGEGVMSLWNL